MLKITGLGVQFGHPVHGAYLTRLSLRVSGQNRPWTKMASTKTASIETSSNENVP